MNTLVNFELAKLLKEKGFDVYCGKKYVSQCLWQKPNSREKYKNSEIHKNSSDVSAPTIAEVVMWLYEKHGIWIECLHRGDMGDFTFKISKLKKGWRTEPHYIHNKGFNTPTEAYESAIEYILTKLI